MAHSPASHNNQRRLLQATIGFWLSIGVIHLFSLQLDADRYQTGFRITALLFAATMVVYLCWAVLTLGLFKLLRQPVVNGRISQVAVIFFIGAVLWIPSVTVLDNSFSQALSNQAVRPLLQQLQSIRFIVVFFNLILYFIVFFLCAGFIYYEHSQASRLAAIENDRRHTEAQLKLSRLSMQALQSQLSPHFLFNSLNSISALARTRTQDELLSAIARLGDLLRIAVNASNKTFIKLDEELEFTANYIELQRLRFGHRFTSDIIRGHHNDILMCPPFIIQTLVENAFLHAVEKTGDNIHIQIATAVSDGYLHITVINTLPADSQKTDDHDGLGLALDNLDQRLQLLYSSHQIRQTSGDNQYRIVISLPLETVSGSDHD
ncbi:MAG: hypothetical protein Tsb002_21370 [Wenzhouxiangellaceae bacterium]